MHRQFLVLFSFLTVGIVAVGVVYPYAFFLLGLVLPLFVLGLFDMFQTRQTVRRNFPVLGHFRYLFELIRPEINQYFVESNSDGVPFSRERRSIVYQRAKKDLDTLPFGTQLNVYDVGYEWVNHSIAPVHCDPKKLRVTVGGPQCQKSYSASLLNISAMSFGSLSQNAILALNAGAKIGGFAHNTGEGGLSPYHLQPGGDLIWQIGTGYFSARNTDGTFSPERFRERATHESIKMIELKLSQGAKPGHGGILPARKLTREIAEIRGVEMGRDVLSPPGHSAFSTPIEMMEFLGKLRELSGGKPVGFKLCIGRRREFLAICKAMLETKVLPDFITVDGGEGGTGAAPIEFSNYVGFPLREALIFVHNSLTGFGIRDKIKVIASGKVVTGFDIVAKLAIGADMVNSARAMMMALGCIQALRCNTNACPVGVATQDPHLVRGLVVEDKKWRVARYQEETLKSVGELLGAMGLSGVSELRPWHLMRRVGFSEVRHYGELYSFLKSGDLLREPMPPEYSRAFHAATPYSFQHLEDIEKSSERNII